MSANINNSREHLAAEKLSLSWHNIVEAQTIQPVAPILLSTAARVAADCARRSHQRYLSALHFVVSLK